MLLAVAILLSLPSPREDYGPCTFVAHRSFDLTREEDLRDARSFEGAGIAVRNDRRGIMMHTGVGAAWFETNPLYFTSGFQDALASWNVEVPAGAGARLLLRAGRGAGCSAWLPITEWGELPPATLPACDFGRIETDFFRSSCALDYVQLRVEAFGSGQDVRVERLDVCVRGSGIEKRLFICGNDPRIRFPDPPVGRLAVPFRSQRAEDPALAGRICSPSSLAMLMAFRGVEQPTALVARRAYDPAHDIYGNGPRNVQAAFSLGVRGYLTAFSNWIEVAWVIEDGQPLVIRIAAEDRELRGAPYKSTDSQLLVLCGFDERRDCLVNDPGAPDAKSGMRTCKREELTRCWLGRGGSAFVLLPPTKP